MYFVIAGHSPLKKAWTPFCPAIHSEPRFSTDNRFIGERSDALLRTAMPGGDEWEWKRLRHSPCNSAIKLDVAQRRPPIFCNVSDYGKKRKGMRYKCPGKVRHSALVKRLKCTSFEIAGKCAPSDRFRKSILSTHEGCLCASCRPLRDNRSRWRADRTFNFRPVGRVLD